MNFTQRIQELEKTITALVNDIDIDTDLQFVAARRMALDGENAEMLRLRNADPKHSVNSARLNASDLILNLRGAVEQKGY